MRLLARADVVAKVRLGDGVVRVRAGESLWHESHTHNGVTPTRLAWTEWHDDDLVGGLSEGENRPLLPPVVHPAAQLQGADGPAVIYRECYFLGSGGSDGELVESRRVCFHANSEESSAGWGESVVVIREGLALPTKTLLDITNAVHAVLVLRDSSGGSGDEYFYPHNDFALSAEEEDSLVEWGMGRPLFSGVLLAVGGVLLVALAERVWRPAAVGVLLVAGAHYRIQGALTRMIRINSGEWKRHELVPSGIHGTERAAQSLLLTVLALADLLDSRVLLLVGLVAAASQVVLMEVAGQVVITWGFQGYVSTLSLALLSCWQIVFLWMFLCFFYFVFAGALTAYAVCSLLLFWLESVQCWAALSVEVKNLVGSSLSTVGAFVVAAGVAVLDCIGLDIKVCLAPWKWPLTQAPDGIRSALRLPGLWLVVVAHCFFAAFLPWVLWTFKTKSDRNADVVGLRGARGSARLQSGLYEHYSVSSIPSRNVFHDVGGASGGGCHDVLAGLV